LQIRDREILRIFRLEDKKITLFSFFNDIPVIESVYQAESQSKIVYSEDSDEIAVISFEE
jgi:hypothetical protein